MPSLGTMVREMLQEDLDKRAVGKRPQSSQAGPTHKRARTSTISPPRGATGVPLASGQLTLSAPVGLGDGVGPSICQESSGRPMDVQPGPSSPVAHEKRRVQAASAPEGTSTTTATGDTRIGSSAYGVLSSMQEGAQGSIEDQASSSAQEVEGEDGSADPGLGLIRCQRRVLCEAARPSGEEAPGAGVASQDAEVARVISVEISGNVDELRCLDDGALLRASDRATTQVGLPRFAFF